MPALAGCSGLADFELAFLGYALKRLRGTLDPVLTIVSIGWEQPDHLIGAAGGRPGDIAGGKIDGLTHDKLVLQRLLHHSEMPAALGSPAARPAKRYSTPAGLLASYITAWQMRDFAGLSAA